MKGRSASDVRLDPPLADPRLPVRGERSLEYHPRIHPAGLWRAPPVIRYDPEICQRPDDENHDPDHERLRPGLIPGPRRMSIRSPRTFAAGRRLPRNKRKRRKENLGSGRRGDVGRRRPGTETSSGRLGEDPPKPRRPAAVAPRSEPPRPRRRSEAGIGFPASAVPSPSLRKSPRRLPRPGRIFPPVGFRPGG